MTIKLTLLDILNSSTNWNDIYTQLSNSNLSKKSIGNLFEEFCKYYYLAELSVCNDYKNVWLFSEAPPLVREKLNIGIRDHGIDLILEGHDNDFSSVQCKFRSDQNAPVSWTKDNLASFFAESEKAKYIIVFTNASGVDSYSLTKNRGRIKVVTLGDLLNLSQSTINQIKNRIKGKKITAPVKKPRDYQQNAINAVINGFKQQDRGKLVTPCGTGKTLTALWIKEALMAKHTLVVVPSLALLRQIKNEWNANNNDSIPYICVCSEKDIDKENDGLVVTIAEIPGGVTTDPKKIREFLSLNKKSIIYSTYQSLEVIGKAMKDLNFSFDLSISDEAHKTAGHRSNKFCLIHEEENIKIKKRLYMTATPRVLSNRLKNERKNEEVPYLYDMNNRNVFGSEFYRMNFKEAIDRKILVDYRIIAMGVSNREVEEMIKQRKYNPTYETTVDEIANNYALEKFRQEYGTAHAITFHSTVSKAKDFKKRHKDIFPDTPAYHVNGTLTTNERNVIMSEFKNSEYAVMTNARCLTEGIDIPAIDTVFFCDPKNSKVDIVQATGRALRKAHNKEKQLGYIVVPIYHTDEEKLEEQIENGLFKNLISVVRALSSEDERLEEEITRIKSAKGKSPIISQHISTNLTRDLIILSNFTDRVTAQIKDNLFCQEISKIRLSWLPFEEARSSAHSLKLNSKNEWAKYSKDGKLPTKIPSKPERVYKNSGWIGWGDWLGTGNKHPRENNFLSYEEAKKHVHQLSLKNQKAWQEYARSGNKPDFLPFNPAQTYEKRGWISWEDWLGTNSNHPGYKKYVTYKEAEEYARRQNLKNAKEWQKHWRLYKPAGIHAKPDRCYKNKGWESWGKFLGNGNVSSLKIEKREFNQARLYVHTLKLKNWQEWKLFCKSGKKPSDIPSNPRGVYKNDGWVSVGDWLGTDFIHTQNRIYLPYEKAKQIIHAFNLKSVSEWRKFSKTSGKPDNIPTAPNIKYRNSGWIDWNDWLGVENKSPFSWVFLPFEEARQFVRSLNLKNGTAWLEYCKTGNKPESIPSNPDKVYKNKGWISMSDWLGVDYISTKKRTYQPYGKARKFIHKFKLQTRKEYQLFFESEEKFEDIPKAPDQVYKENGWISWGDWLGTNFVSTQGRIYLPYEDARLIIHKFKIQSQRNYREFCKNGKKPENIPAAPVSVYKGKGWISWGDWLGTNFIPTQKRIYISYEEARLIIHKFKIQSVKEYHLFCKSGIKPDNIPSNPDKKYKGKGWISWGDWLGWLKKKNNFDE